MNTGILVHVQIIIKSLFSNVCESISYKKVLLEANVQLEIHNDSFSINVIT